VGARGLGVSTVDALAASPLALLDARGSLRFVTDLVHEDDALCLALVCRAMRDALWARFPRREVLAGPAGARHDNRAIIYGESTQAGLFVFLTPIASPGRTAVAARVFTSLAGAVATVPRFFWVCCLPSAQPKWAPRCAPGQVCHYL
jgi:hypothetical protein